MRKLLIIIPLLLFSCSSESQLKTIAKLPKKLAEVSGITQVKNSDLLLMHNDSGNKNKIYGVTTSGKLKTEITVNAKNTDWEDITSDEQGNLYIADFGNNKNTREDLVILKIKNKDLLDKKSVDVEKIRFSYPNQHKFPPKKEELFFDAESILYYNDNLYIFTKSRVKDNYGVTNLYKIPSKKGNYTAEFIGTFNNCSDRECWITAAAISPDKTKVALLTLNSVIIISDFSSDNFLDGKAKTTNLKTTQKEGVTFKNNNTLYITDEKDGKSGGKLYELKI